MIAANASPSSVPLMISRRRVLWWTAAIGLVRGSAHAQAGNADAALAAAVRAKVIARESLADAMRPFRQGGSALITAAVEQYVSVQAEFAGRTPARLAALRWALRVYIDESRRGLYGKAPRCAHVDGSVTSFGPDSFKCNKLVADAYAAGAGRGLSIGSTWNGAGDGTGWPAMKTGTDLWPPQANELADRSKNIRCLTNARPLRWPGEPKAAPELGDLIAFPAQSGSGHVGLYLGRDLIVSAKESGVEIHPLAYERAMHNNIVVIRKFTGSGQ